MDDRLHRMYDKIDDVESSLIEAKAKNHSIEGEKVTGDNIYKVLIFFEKLYGMMNEEEQLKLMEALIHEIQIYEERQPNGQWLKSITFRIPFLKRIFRYLLELVWTMMVASRRLSQCQG